MWTNRSVKRLVPGRYSELTTPRRCRSPCKSRTADHHRRLRPPSGQPALAGRATRRSSTWPFQTLEIYGELRRRREEDLARIGRDRRRLDNTVALVRCLLATIEDEFQRQRDAIGGSRTSCARTARGPPGRSSTAAGVRGAGAETTVTSRFSPCPTRDPSRFIASEVGRGRRQLGASLKSLHAGLRTRRDELRARWRGDRRPRLRLDLSLDHFLRRRATGRRGVPRGG